MFVILKEVYILSSWNYSRLKKIDEGIRGYNKGFFSLGSSIIICFTNHKDPMIILQGNIITIYCENTSKREGYTINVNGVKAFLIFLYPIVCYDWTKLSTLPLVSLCYKYAPYLECWIVAYPLAPLTTGVTYPLAPWSIDVGHTLAPWSTDVHYPLAPWSTDVHYPLAPWSTDIDNPLAPWSTDVDYPLEPWITDVNYPLAPYPLYPVWLSRLTHLS